MSSDSLKIVVHGKSETIYIECDEIIYCKAEGNYTRIYVHNNNIIVSRVLKHVAKCLPKEVFLRIHKSYLINKNYAYAYKRNNKLILSPSIEVPVSRRKKTKILKELSENLLII